MNKNKYLSILLFFLFLLTCKSVHSFTHDLTFSLGNLCEYVGKIQTDINGSKNTCGFLPYLTSSVDYPFSSKFFISPQIGLTLPKSGRDPKIHRMSIIALMNTKYKTPYVNLHGGLGFFITRISGDGGEAMLNNGNGTDSFPLPSEAVYSRNFILNLGVSFDFSKEWSGEFHSYVFNTLTSEDRALTLGLNATYHLGEIL